MENQNIINEEKGNDVNHVLAAGIIVKCRYSENDNYDDQGRWMRTFHYNDLFIGQISKIRHEGINLYTLRVNFPCGNCFTSVHPVSVSKNECQTLINELIKLWSGFLHNIRPKELCNHVFKIIPGEAYLHEKCIKCGKII
jgi:hypothetical protein